MVGEIAVIIGSVWLVALFLVPCFGEGEKVNQPCAVGRPGCGKKGDRIPTTLTSKLSEKYGSG